MNLQFYSDTASDVTGGDATVLTLQDVPMAPGDLVYVGVKYEQHFGAQETTPAVDDGTNTGTEIGTWVESGDGIVYTHQFYYICSGSVPGGTRDVVVTLPAAREYMFVSVLVVHDADGGSFALDGTNYNKGTGASTNPALASLSNSGAGVTIEYCQVGSGVSFTDVSPWTQDEPEYLAHHVNTSSGSVTPAVTLSGSASWCLVAASFVNTGPGSTTEISSYRWRNDDGSETTATWIVAEDNAFSGPTLDTNYRLRFQVAADGDPSSASYKIQGKRTGDLAYWDVPVGAPSQVVQTITTPGDGTFVVPDNVFSIVVEAIGGGGAGGRRSTNGAGGGGSGGAYAKKTIAVDPGQTINYHVGAGATQAATPSNGEDTTVDTTVCVAKGGVSVAANTAAGATAPSSGSSTGDTIFTAGNGATGTSGSFGGGGGSSGGSAANGNNGSSGTGGSAPTGGGAGGNGRSTTQGAGTSGSAPGGGGGGGLRTSSGTQNGGSGAAGQLKITYTPTPPATIRPSSNIAAAAATATTAQLSVPSGKSFTAGKIADDLNAVTVDIAADNYTEIEFCIQFHTPFAIGEAIDFKLTNVTDVTNVADVFIPSATSLTINESAGLTEALSYLLNIPAPISESLSITDTASVSISSGSAINVTANDAGGVVTDTATAILRIPILINEAVLAVDSQLVDLIYGLPDEQAAMSDTATASIEFDTTNSETTSAVDTVSYLLRIPRNIDELAALIDSLNYLLRIPTTVSESVGLTDSASVDINAESSPIQEAAALSDTATATVVINITISETVGTVDTAQPGVNGTLIFSVNETVAVSDSASVRITYAIALSDSVLVVDSARTNLPPVSHGDGGSSAIRRRRR